MSPQFSEYHSLKVVDALTAKVVNDDTEGTGADIDTIGYNSCLIVANVGVSGDTLAADLDHNFKLEHADDDGSGAPDTYAAVTSAADVVGATPDSSTGVFQTIDAAAEDPAVLKVAYVGPKRWVRLVDDTAGTHTNGTPMAAFAILGHPQDSEDVNA